MSKLLQSSAILAFARATNYAFLLLSPILLVRILDPYAFGQYREFMVFAMLIASLAMFAIPTNLLYFVPHDPQGARQYVSHSHWLVGMTSALAVLLIWAFGDLLRANTSYDFVTYLVLYVLLFINFDVLESYWVARQQPRYVFYYSTLRTVVRLAAVLVTAWLTRSVTAILQAIIAVEALRVIVVLIVLHRLDLLTLQVDRGTLRRQLAFVIPLGLAGCLHYLNESLGQVAISTQLGVVALATYTIGAYQVPVLSIVRGAIGDAVFPEVVRRVADRGKEGLLLWKRSNVAYTAIIVPVIVPLVWYADVLIPLVFSAQYVESVPVFRVLAIVMLLQCFEFSSPLRAVNRNGPLLWANFLMIAVNAAVIVSVFRMLPERALMGPALGIVIGYAVQLGFLARWILRIYDLRLAELLKWGSLARMAGCSLAAGIVLPAGEFIEPPVLRMLAGATVFVGGYLLLLRLARIEEVETVTAAVLGKLRRR